VVAESPTLRRLAYTGTLLSVAGLAIDAYLTIAHYHTATVLSCPENVVVNCTKVTSSSYSVQHGVPLVLAGLAFFAIMLALQLPAAWRSQHAAVRRARVTWAVVGAVSVLWLIYVELFSLDAICLYCTVVHALSILLFVLTVVGTAATTPDFSPTDDDDDPEIHLAASDAGLGASPPSSR